MNETLHHIYEHRSIRAFKPRSLTSEEVHAIVKAGQHTPTYTFLQAATIIGVEDSTKKTAIAEICTQPYVAESGYLFIIVADMARNKAIAEAKGHEDFSVLDTADRFLATMYDATMMTMNMVTAAESMGLGAVVLGSINNDMQALIDLLELPPYTFPCLGLAVGEPNQSPQLKPRLPEIAVFMKDRYQAMENPLAELADYDEVVHEYYDLRNASQRVDRFTDQMVRAMGPVPPLKRGEILKVLQKQGFLKR